MGTSSFQRKISAPSQSNENQETGSQQSSFSDNRESTDQITQLQSSVDNSSNTQEIKQLQEKVDNSTGMPDDLKQGVESLSGQDMSDVKVTYNSDKPAQLQAHAFANGNDIHLAPGQEKHLPHEAWHVVQQKQGRVQPTTQVNGAPINDDKSLESEADKMGQKALQLKSNNSNNLDISQNTNSIFQLNSVIKDQINNDITALGKAKTLGDIANVINNTTLDKDEAAIKLENTEKGIKRATEQYTKFGMADEQEAYIDDRKGLAISDQKDGLIKKLQEHTDYTKKPNYGDYQWDATVGGPNKDKILAPEVVLGTRTTTEQVIEKTGKKEGKSGLAKLFAVGALFGTMDEALQKLWQSNCGGDWKTAKAEFIQSCKNANKLVTQPASIKDELKDDFKKFEKLDAAFTKPVTGCMGMMKDYTKFEKMQDAIKALALKKEDYADGGFILNLPTAQIEDAKKTKDNKGEDVMGEVGKASVFTSLMFSEFNYIADINPLDRATNETKNAKTNDGVKGEGGKTEVMVTNFNLGVMLGQGAIFLK